MRTSLTVPANLDSLRPIADFVTTAAAAAGLSPRVSYRLRLAVDEFATNAISYGHVSGAEGVLELGAVMDQTTLRIILEDDGIPFDPSGLPPPNDLHLPAEQRNLGGLGIYLALKNVDSYAYERVGGRNRSTLIMNLSKSSRTESPPHEITTMTAVKGKIGVLIESHFDETEYHRFGEFFPQHNYQVEFISHLWNQRQLIFKGNDNQEEITVNIEVNNVSPADYVGLMLIGGYAMDRLRYEEHPKEGRPNQAPAVVFLRKAVAAMDKGHLHIGAICHGLWLFCAAPELLKGRKVTCAHNIICDVASAGGIPIYDGDQLKETYVDGNLVTGRHPGVVEEFMQTFLQQIDPKVPVS